jgi:DeoR/GlpR family transcriptional regulator of sugar metabolism
MDFARERGRLKVADVVTLTGVSRNTVKKNLQQLVIQQHLVPHGAGRGAWYGLV